MQIAAAAGPAFHLEELCRDAAHCSCAYGNVVIVYSAAEPDRTYCVLNARRILEYGQKHPSGLGMLVLISADEPPPSEAARNAIRDSYVAMKEVIRVGVLVVEGEGFAAAAKRSAITLINLSSRLPFPMKVAGDVIEGAAKIVKLLGSSLAPGLDVQLLAAAVMQTKTRLA